MKWNVRQLIIAALCFACLAIIYFGYTRVLNPLMIYGPAMNARSHLGRLCGSIHQHWLDNGRWPTQESEWNDTIADYRRTWRGMRLQMSAKEFGGRLEMDVTARHWVLGPKVRMRIALEREDMEKESWETKIPQISDPAWRLIP